MSSVAVRAQEPREDPAAAVLVLADGAGPVELGHVRRWAQDRHPGQEILATSDPGLLDRLGRDGTRVVPVRVAWDPSEDPGVRSRVGDILLHVDPESRLGRVKPLLAKRYSERARVLEGAPATVGELREAFAEESVDGGPEAFAAFVRRRAVLACDRAERAERGDHLKVPRLVVEQIMASQRFADRVARLAHELGRDEEDVRAEAREGLDEIVSVQSRTGSELYRTVLSPMYARAWDVECNAERLEELRERNRDAALVFLPAHRSYVDPLVVNEALHAHRFQPNHVLGGNNMAVGPIGVLGRRAGVVFIRRSFGSDRVYKLVVAEYLRHLVTKRFNLEWYPEGGRSRTGKLRPPRLGLLNYLAGAVSDGEHDALLVPTSIVYDRAQEVGAIVAEQQGATKKREGLSWLASYVKAQRTKAGAARVTFGEPFSLRDALAESGEGSTRLPKVAFRVMVGINAVTPITGTALAGFVLLGEGSRAMTLGEVRAAVEPLVAYLESKGVGGPALGLREEVALRGTLADLERSGVAERFDGGEEPVWAIARDRHHEAAFYRNAALHHFVDRSIVELGLARVCEPHEGRTIDCAWEETLAIRDLMKFEFFFAEKETFREEIYAEIAHFGPDWRSRIDDEDGPREMLRRLGLALAPRVIGPFLDALYVHARCLDALDPADEVDRDALVDACMGTGRQLLLQEVLARPESVSRDLFAGAHKLAENRGLLDGDAGPEERAARRRALLDEVTTIRDRCGRLDAIVAGRTEVPA